jgi:hypothetical protein
VAGGAAGVTRSLNTAIEWAFGTLIAVVVAITTLIIIFRRQIAARFRRPLVTFHENRTTIIDKQIELEKIRAMRLALEASRMSGRPVSPEIAALIEDHELIGLYREAARRSSVGGYPSITYKREQTER